MPEKGGAKCCRVSFELWSELGYPVLQVYAWPWLIVHLT